MFALYQTRRQLWMIVSETNRVIGMGVVRQLRTRSFHQYYRGWYPGRVPICHLDCFWFSSLLRQVFLQALWSSPLQTNTSKFHFYLKCRSTFYELQAALKGCHVISKRLISLKICIQLINLLLSLEFQVSKFISITLTPKSASATKYPKAFEVVLLNVTGGAK